MLREKIQGELNRLWSNTERLEMLAGKETAARRQAARHKVDQLKCDLQHLSSALQSLAMKTAERERRAMQREQLLATTFTTNDRSRNGEAGGGETSILIDRALQHQDGLNRSNKYLGDMLTQGSEILSNLREQRGTLKGVQKKILDVANTLGMSNTVIRLIERRSEGDKYILWGGMLGTCIFMFLVVKFFT